MPHVLAADGSLDRAAVAAIVFADPDALKALNGIVHPAVGAEMNRQVMAEVGTDHVVVMDIPLLTENPRDGLQGKIVVDVPVETQVERLVQFRGFDEADAHGAHRASRRPASSGWPAPISWSTTAATWPRSSRRSTRCGRGCTSLPQLPADFEFAGRKDRAEQPPTS